MNMVDVRYMIRRAATKAGSIRAAAAELGVDHAYLYRVMVGERDPGEQILDALGLERIVIYRKKVVDKNGNGR